MDLAKQIGEIFSKIPNIWFFFCAGLFTVIIRTILSLFKALAINNGEIDKCNQVQWKNKGFWLAFKHSFCFSTAKDIRIDDYGLPALIGYSEVVFYPLFITNGWFPAIGAWIAIKTASSWSGWQKTRTAYNRFLLRNILSLNASLLMYSLFIRT
jgi:hypothetical protein